MVFPEAFGEVHALGNVGAETLGAALGHSMGESLELFRVAGGDVQVLGVASHDSEAVYQLSQHGVGFAEDAGERVVKVSFLAQSFDRFQGVCEPEFGVFPALRYLPGLDVVLYVNDAARAEPWR